MFVDLCVGVDYITPKICAMGVQPHPLLELSNVQVTLFGRHIFDLFIFLPHLFGVLKRVQLH